MQRLADFLTLRRWWVYCIALAAVGLIGHAQRALSPWDGLFDFQGEPLCGDFSTFYTAGHLGAEGQDLLIYDRSASMRMHGELIGLDPNLSEADRAVMDATGGEASSFFLNPPTFVVLVAPFSRLPYIPAATLWSLLSLILMAAGAHLVSRRLLIGLSTKRVLLLGCLFVPLQISLGLGQNTALSLSISTFAFFALRSRKDLLAGLLIGCLIIKPQLGLGFAIVLLGGRRWVAVGGAFLGVAAWVSATLLLVPDAWEPFLESVPLASEFVRGLHGRYPTYLSTSVLGALDLLLQPLSEVLPMVLASAMALGVIAITFRRWLRIEWAPGSRTWDLTFAATLGLTWLISPHMLIYDVALFLLPAAITAHWVWKGQRPFGGGAFSAVTFGCIALSSLWIQLVLGHAHTFLDERGLPIVLPQLVTVGLVVWSLMLWRSSSDPSTPSPWSGSSAAAVEFTRPEELR